MGVDGGCSRRFGRARAAGARLLLEFIMRNWIVGSLLLCLGSLTTGCKDPGEAYADAICECKDKDCMEKVNKEYEGKFPESKMKLGEIEKLPEDKKKQLGRAMECMLKQAK
jgi:hypothetical protein